MPTEESHNQSARSDNIQAYIGPNAQQVAVGKDITQQQQIGGSIEITEDDLEQIRRLFVDLEKQIDQAAPPEKRTAALERIGELKDELVSKKPRVSTIDYVKNWFTKNLPSLVGAITSVLVNPIIGKVVEAAGEMAAQEFKHHFGQ